MTDCKENGRNAADSFECEPTFENLEGTGKYKINSIIMYSVTVVFAWLSSKSGIWSKKPDIISLCFYAAVIIIPFIIAVIETLHFIRIDNRNGKILSRISKHVCHTHCSECGKDFSYTGADLVKSHNCSHGVVICPGCRAKINHSRANINKIS